MDNPSISLAITLGTPLVLSVAWLIAHLLAEPGTEVSLAGVIKYQKRAKVKKKNTLTNFIETKLHMKIVESFVVIDSTKLRLEEISEYVRRKEDYRQVEIESAIEDFTSSGLLERTPLRSEAQYALTAEGKRAIAQKIT